MKAKAYYSDPELYNTFIGRCSPMWHHGSGILELDCDRLTYASGLFPCLALSRTNVLSIEMGSFSRFTKPLRLKLLDIRFLNEEGIARSIYLVPFPEGRSPWRTAVWQTNKCVEEWFAALSSWHPEQDYSSVRPEPAAQE